ncbi:MAG TPA: hypothetical protein VJ022_08465 [Anaerolineales bacterium]|nr:hypothetical protein [Anaerolineales bacterium]
MPKKINRIKKIYNNTEIEPADSPVEAKGTTHDRVEVLPPGSIPTEEPAGLPGNDEISSSSVSDSTIPLSSSPDSLVNPKKEVPVEDPLDDVRLSLIADETLEAEKKSKKWWRRNSKKSRKDTIVKTEGNFESLTDFPTGNNTSLDVVDERIQDENQRKEPLQEFDELIDMLVTEIDEKAEGAGTPSVDLPSEPEVSIDMDDLKKQVFQPRAAGEEPEISSEVRSVIMEDGEEIFVEVQSARQDTLTERVAAVENALKPYRRYIYFTIAFLGIVIAAGASLLLFNIYNQFQPPEPVEEVSLPFPTSMSLPGGLNFALGKGTLTDGEWNPRGPEWLEGTEVCRWVAIPWSRQLEAVIRTLNPNDPIELVMSNNDKLVYKVYSVRQMNNEELQKVDTNSPCLLLVLAEADSEKRWVLTALP